MLTRDFQLLECRKFLAQIARSFLYQNVLRLQNVYSSAYPPPLAKRRG